MAEQTGRIVVGHDGSEHARSALRWAARQAALTGSPLVVVRAWSVSSAPAPASQRHGYVPPLEDFEHAVLEELRAEVDDDLGSSAEIPVEYLAPHTDAADALIDAASDAELLVVGARGLGSLRELILGSVSDRCIRHARCPVVVVRSSDRLDPPQHDDADSS